MDETRREAARGDTAAVAAGPAAGGAEAAGREPSAEALAHLRRADPVLGRLIDERPGFDPRAWMAGLPPLHPFGVLIFQVIGQQLSVAATRRILDRLVARFDGRLPGPAQLLAADPAELRAAGLSARKVATLRDVAARFATGALSDEAFADMSDEEVERALTAIPGIGRWTAHGFLIVALDRPDVVLPGDLALRKAVQRLYRLEHLPSEEEMLRIAEPWRPWRSLGTAYVFASAFDRPPAGPGASESPA